MANIDNLNFQVILGDEDFKEKVKEDMELAKQLNVSLSALLDLKSKIKSSGITAKATNDAIREQKLATAISNRAAAEERLATAQTNRTAASERLARDAANRANAESRAATAALRNEEAQRRVEASVRRTNKAYSTQSRILGELKNVALGYFSIHGATKLVSSLVRVTGEFELQRTTLAAMLGDLNKAEQVITKIQGLAVESPFQFKELTTYAKQLSAFSVPAEELYETTKMLADISAGLGVGMDRIVLAYGQVRSAAFLRGQEVRQFTEAGIPILDELAKQFSELEGRAVSAGEVFDKISQRLVPFEMVAKVFKDMTSEGGKFYNMQEVQAETLRGKLSNLKDAYEVMLNEIGKGQSENIKGAVDWARRLMQNYEDTGRTLVELIAAYGIYKTTLLGLTAVTGTFELANHKLLSSLVNAGKWAMKNPYVLVAAGLTAIGYAAYKSITKLDAYDQVMKSLNDTNSSFTKSITSETAKLDALYAKLELAKEGTEAYANAKKSIYSQYSTYISELQNEGIAVDNLANIYDKLKDKITASQKARFREVAFQSLEKEYEYQTNSLLSEAEKATERIIKKLPIEFSQLEKEAVQAYVAGTLSMSDLQNDKRLERLGQILTQAADSGNKAWEQFGLSIDSAKTQFELATAAYAEGLQVIDEIYGKAENTASNGLNPFVYDLTGGGKGKSPAQKAIEEQIKSIQKLQDAYEKLLPFLNEIQMKSTLKALFPNVSESVIDSLDFNTELHRLADELARFDEDAAQRLKDTIGKDVAGTLADSFKAMEEYRKSLDAWKSEDFNVSGKGIAFDISKIISNLENEYAKIDRKRLKNLELLSKAQAGDELALKKIREVYGEEVWNDYLEKGKSVIDDLAIAERNAAKETANEKIRDLASKYVNQKLAEKNIDTSNLEDKTLEQIREQVGRLQDLVSEANKEKGNILAAMMNGDISEGQMASFEMLSKVVEILGVKIKDLNGDETKKLIAQLQNGLGYAGELGSQFESLGKDIDMPWLEKMGKEISRVTDEINTLIKSFEDGDKFSTIAQIIISVFTRTAEVITEAYEHQFALNDATREYAELQNEIRRQQHSDIFGVDEMALAAENLAILTEAQERYQNTLSEFNKIRFQANGSRDSFTKTSLGNVMETISKGQGWDLYLSNGELNIQALEAYYDAYSNRLTKKQRNLIQSLISDGKALEDASAQQAEYLTNLFNGVADNIASSMVDAFAESGDAAIDFKDIVSGVAKDLASDLIKTMYLKPILDELESTMDEIDNSGKSEEEKANARMVALTNALNKLQDKEDQINATLEPFKQYWESSESIDSLPEGIKGMTEDTANLLASYINAMRSDVSQIRTLQATHLPIISAAMPTIMDHLAQINAHTYDTSQHTQQMLSELILLNGKIGDVISDGSNGSAIKVLM